MKNCHRRIWPSRMAETLYAAMGMGVVRENDNLIVFYDIARLKRKLSELSRAFPGSTLHAVAVKANPLLGILKLVAETGHGAEVASEGELKLALSAGFDPIKLVFDSPVKTRDELRLALEMGIYTNANSLAELNRISDLYTRIDSSSRVGLRVNPEIGQGTISSTSVATSSSKFGVPAHRERKRIHLAFNRYPWLSGLHVHIGSQGMALEELVSGIGVAYDMFIDSQHSFQIDTFDIGGGLPARYSAQDRLVTAEDYATALKTRCPALFESNFSLITEFGRYIHADCGWTAARIEYILKYAGSIPTIVTHVGADMYLRKAYCPEDWHHDISVCDSRGVIRSGPTKVFQVAGPLCFAGDFLARRIELPEDTREGDFLLIHESGAYTFSMWSVYNSRAFPPVVAYEAGTSAFRILRKRQTSQEIISYWSSV